VASAPGSAAPSPGAQAVFAPVVIGTHPGPAATNPDCARPSPPGDPARTFFEP
jgi:hypothetical protein